jgi:hypothetical protein
LLGAPHKHQYEPKNRFVAINYRPARFKPDELSCDKPSNETEFSVDSSHSDRVESAGQDREKVLAAILALGFLGWSCDLAGNLKTEKMGFDTASV